MKIDDIEENAYSKYLKAGLLNKHSIEPHITDIMRATREQRNELIERMNKIISRGLAVYDNTYVYFKLWCYIYARSVFATYNEQVQIPAAGVNTRLVHVEFGNAANIPVWEDLDTYANDQYLTFFETRNHTQNFITMMHIIGNDALYFDNIPGHDVCPWHGIRFPGVHVLYIHHTPFAHQPIDISAHELMRETIHLATIRGEGDELHRGLLYAMEFIAGSNHRHTRIIVPARGVAVVNPPHENITLTGARGIPPYYSDQGGPRAGTRPIAARQAYVPGGRNNPDHLRYQGDFHRNDRDVSYNPAEWSFLMLDAYMQHRHNGFARVRGVNW